MIEVNEITKRTDIETDTETEKRQKWRLLKIDKRHRESCRVQGVQEGESYTIETR